MGHVRNAIQLLEMVSSGVLVGGEAQAAVRAASNRLWLALDEIDRLQLSRELLGRKVRFDDVQYELRETNA